MRKLFVALVISTTALLITLALPTPAQAGCYINGNWRGCD